jgi:hypothetical protein
MVYLVVHPETRGDLFSAPIDANAITEFYSRRCSLWLFAWPVFLLQCSRQSGTSVGISANSLQLAGSGNIPERFIHYFKFVFTPSLRIMGVFRQFCPKDSQP